MTSVEIFRAKRVITLADAEPEAFAVQNERIVAVGSVADLRSRFPEAGLTDVGDGVVVPGFNDAHMHPSSVAEDLLNLDVSSTAVSSLAELTQKVLGDAVAKSPGTWIRATRYDDAKMAEGRVLTRWDLDEVAPEHPVIVVQVAGHWAVVNSRALELGGLTDGSAAPSGGDFGRDAAGHLNGVLYERALTEFNYPNGVFGPPLMPVASLDDRLRGLQRAQQLFHASGLTSLGDAHVRPRALTRPNNLRGSGSPPATSGSILRRARIRRCRRTVWLPLCVPCRCAICTAQARCRRSPAGSVADAPTWAFPSAQVRRSRIPALLLAAQDADLPHRDAHVQQSRTPRTDGCRAQTSAGATSSVAAAHRDL